MWEKSPLPPTWVFSEIWEISQQKSGAGKTAATNKGKWQRFKGKWQRFQGQGAGKRRRPSRRGQTVVNLTSETNAQEKILPIITKVNIYGPQGQVLEVNVLLDSASTANYITTKKT